MLTEKQKNFIIHWENVRENENTIRRKIIGGLPMATLFGLPIILLIVVVYIFFPDWYMKISGTTSGSFAVITIAVLIAILFFSYFRMHFKWEMNEQLYTELKQKSKKHI